MPACADLHGPATGLHKRNACGEGKWLPVNFDFVKVKKLKLKISDTILDELFTQFRLMGGEGF